MRAILPQAISNPVAFLRPLNVQILYKTAEIIENENPTKVLDIGTGICLLLSILELSPNALCIGLDQRFDNLQEGRKVLKQHGVQNCSLVQSPGQILPFIDNSFDTVAIVTTFMNIKDMKVVEEIICEMLRILKSKGLAIFEFRNKYSLLLWLKHRLNYLVEDSLPLAMFTFHHFRKILRKTGWCSEKAYPVWKKAWIFTPSYIVTARKS